MRILIVTQYFWPEQFFFNKLPGKLKKLGHEVTVITGKPNYPEGVTYDGYTSGGIEKESFDGVEVLRVPLRPRGKGGINLVANYMSFIVSGVRYMPSLVEGRGYDTILFFGLSPMTSAIPAILLKRKLKAHLVIWVQDLWPQSLEATGYVKNKLLLKLVGLLVRWIYKKSDTILAQSHSFEVALQKCASKDKIVYYPNSIETPVFPAKNSYVGDDIEQAFGSGFNLVFAGNIGSAQAIPTLLGAANILRDIDCRFIFVGSGSQLGWAKEEVKRLGLKNVLFLGRLDNSLMPIVYDLADALLVSLGANETLSYTVPGKLQACLAAGKPIVASVNGEAGDVVRRANAGIVCASEDSDALASGIKWLLESPEIVRDEMGWAGRCYFNKNFNMDDLSKRLVEIIDMRMKASN